MNLLEQLTASRAEVTTAERRQAEAKSALQALANQEPLADEKTFAAARSEALSAQKAAEAARQRMAELWKLTAGEHRKMVSEAAELIRADWEILRQARTGRARLHELSEAETALAELQNSAGGPRLRARISIYLSNSITQAGIFGVDDGTFGRAEREWAEFLAKMLSD